MPIALLNTTITGLGVDGLPAGSVTGTNLTNNSVTRPKVNINGTWLQLVSTTKVDSFVSSNTGWTAVTGLSISITPTSTSSKILLMCSVNYDSTRSNSGGGFAFGRNGTIIDASIGGAAGGRYRVTMDFGANANADQSGMSRSFTFVDSPATTSSTTYQLYVFQDVSTFTTTINRARYDDSGGAQADDGRFASSVTAIELGG
jgi:hypothetical protein